SVRLVRCGWSKNKVIRMKIIIVNLMVKIIMMVKKIKMGKGNRNNINRNLLILYFYSTFYFQSSYVDLKKLIFTFRKELLDSNQCPCQIGYFDDLVTP